MPAGRAANASSVGAKTVNGPSPLRVSTRPAAVAAVSRVLNEPALVATSTMSPASAAMEGAAVAGAGVAGAGVAAVVEHADTARATAATESRMVRFMV